MRRESVWSLLVSWRRGPCCGLSPKHQLHLAAQGVKAQSRETLTPSSGHVPPAPAHLGAFHHALRCLSGGGDTSRCSCECQVESDA